MDAIGKRSVAAEDPLPLLPAPLRQSPSGWSMLIGDPADHPADVLLHRHFDHTGWLSRSDAVRAARLYVDAIYEQSSSY